MDYSNLFHEKSCFERETFQKRMDELGYKNMGRMELFLWDLELFLQIQNRLRERIVLKGGAATQFYLPVSVQRTSVDIDMLFFGTHEEIEAVLLEIRDTLGDGEGLFEFHEHIPKNPKTTLPLHTYFADIPSVLTAVERRGGDDAPAHQEIKVEFILQPEKREYVLRTGENIFAVNSGFEYQILPLNSLFADKLTTMGRNTIGVQDDRMDEQVKQMYDILMLTKYCLSELDVNVIREKYYERSREEWGDRSPDEDFSMVRIKEDVLEQLNRYEYADSGEDKELGKAINDFHALYLNSKVEYTPASVACGASFVRLMYELMQDGRDWEYLSQVLELEKRLEMKEFEGQERGRRVRQLRDRFIEEFSDVSVLPPKTLRGKNHKRVFWSIITVDNMEQVDKVVAEIEE